MGSRPLLDIATKAGAAPAVLAMFRDREARLRRAAMERARFNAGIPQLHAPWDGAAPVSWDLVVWPEWVPVEVRTQIAAFWGCFGRRPRDYVEQHRTNYANAPCFGERVRLRRLFDGFVEGRYVHAWNNIGRVVRDDGVVECVSTCRDPEVIAYERDAEAVVRG